MGDRRMTTNTLTLIQELYFDVCDLSYGQSYQSLGYQNKIEFLSEFKRKLEIIEQDYQKQGQNHDAISN
jgi:hypothetical protein